MNNEITILYRDEELVVCLKPAGVDSQGSSFENMVDLLRKQLALPDPREIYPVHRLDRGVGGVMVYALSRPFAVELNRQIAEHRWEKTYLCIVSGKPEKQGRMENLLLHRAGENKTYVVSRVRKGVRRAALVYRRIGYLPQQDCSLCVVRLLTGRSHQIRAQFSHRGFPLLGDRRYGSKVGGSIALFSCGLTFYHPKTGEKRSFCQMPKGEKWEDFSEILSEYSQKSLEIPDNL